MKQRRRFDAVIASLIAEARADPNFGDRKDVLALLLQARYEDGEPISDEHIADELLTLLGSGHETTASSLAWALERLSRHPELMSRLAEEADAGGSELRQATIWEVQRTRPVLDGTTRRTKTRIRLGDWVLPEGTNIIITVSSWPTTLRRASRTRGRSTRIGTWAPTPSPLPGSRSAAASTVVSARRSPTWSRTSSCACCYANSVSSQPMRRANGRGGVVWRPCRRRARERWCTGGPTSRPTVPTRYPRLTVGTRNALAYLPL